MPNYARGKIYKLVNDVDDEIYVGSTCGSLKLRKSTHKSMARTKPRPVYHHLNAIGWENVRIVLIEDFACGNKRELLRREQHYIDELRPSLNKRAAFVHCPHGRRRYQCKPCGGAGVCDHGRIRSQCKPCGGSKICEHGRQRHSCKPCGGAGICEHGYQSKQCKDCSPFLCDYCHITTSKGNILRHYRSKQHLLTYTAAYVDCWNEEPTEYPFDKLVH